MTPEEGGPNCSCGGPGGSRPTRRWSAPRADDRARLAGPQPDARRPAAGPGPGRGLHRRGSAVSPAEYLELYKEEGEAPARLAAPSATHRASVSTTLALAFAKVEAASPATADLLRLGALLAPEAIPEEIFLDGAPELGDRLGPACSSRYTFTETISAAHHLSLLQRDPQTRTLSIHRLVQDVMRGHDGRRGAASLVGARNPRRESAPFRTWSIPPGPPVSGCCRTRCPAAPRSCDGRWMIPKPHACSIKQRPI